MRFGRGKKQLLILFATVAVLSSAALQVLPMISQWNQRQLASRIAQGIEKDGRGSSVEQFQRLADLGTPAFSSLVLLASSQKSSVAHRARQTVDKSFATWQVQSQFENDFDLALPTTALASALVIHADRFDSVGQRWATSLAIQMVDLAETLNADDAKELLGECDQVLTAIPPQGPRLRTYPETAQQPLSPDENRLSAPEVRLELLASPSESAREFFAQGPRIDSPISDAQPISSPENGETLLSEPTVSAKTSDSTFPPWTPKWSNKSNLQNSTLEPIDRVVPTPIPNFQRSNDQLPEDLGSEVVDVPTPQEMKQRQESLRKVPSKVLVVQLPKADHYDAGSIRVVLRERGFAEAEWALAKLFISPHGEDRKQLIEAVSTLPAENTRRWLRWLLKDKVAEVRLQALTSLATTNDPQLFHLAREMAVADQDARVSELASRIMDQVR